MQSVVKGRDRFGRDFWLTVLFGLLTAVAVVVLHELGHYLPSRLFGFPGTAFHYGNVTAARDNEIEQMLMRGNLAGVAAIQPIGQLWWAAAGGPIISLILTALCAAGIVRWYHPAWFVAGLQAMSARALVAFSLVLTGRGGGGDELTLALLKRWPPRLVGTLELAVTAALYIFLAWRVRRGERLGAWLALVASTAVGWVIWFDFLGPVLLP